MSNPKIDPEKFALAVVSSVSPNGDSPESVAEEQVAYYLAAFQKAREFNHQKSSSEAEKLKKRNRLT